MLKETAITQIIITIFMCGDVMTGRGIDQVLPHPCEPRIYEPYVGDARQYVEIAERANGPIPSPVPFSYIWGDALEALRQFSPDARIINLETSVTKSPTYWEGKGINYRMHPDNFPAIAAAKIDVCALANNHVLDWGFEGLAETLTTLQASSMKYAGAGQNLDAAKTPAIVNLPGKGRILVFSFGARDCGIPAAWAASANAPGVWLLKDLSEQTVNELKNRTSKFKQSGDIAVASIHWGANWEFDVSRSKQEFARQLIDKAGFDVVHGHSSHHVKGIEVYKEKLILYGCGDFLNDYEGIGGYEWFRGDLALMYFAGVDPATGKLISLQMVPTQTRNFRVNHASKADALWLCNTLNREGRKLGTRFVLDENNVLHLKGYGNY